MLPSSHAPGNKTIPVLMLINMLAKPRNTMIVILWWHLTELVKVITVPDPK